MGAALKGLLLFGPLTWFWHVAGAPWDSLSAVIVGLLMTLGAALRRPWTAWVSSGDWKGMTADPLFLRINQAVSASWGALLVGTGIAWSLGASPVWRWLPFVLGGVASALVPPLWVRRNLTARLRASDPNPWPSPLEAPLPWQPQAPDDDGQSPLDVAVVGAGLGGLTAAALLARAGARVAVFDPQDKPGGFCHCWQGAVPASDGTLLSFRFDAGVHDVSGVFEGGSVLNLLRRLDLQDLLAWRRLDHAQVDDRGRWDLPTDWAGFVEALAHRFPADATGLRRLLADAQTIFNSMYATAAARGGVPGTPTSVEAMKAFARAHPLAVAWMNRSAADWLQHHGLSAAAQAQLLSLSGYLTHDARQLQVRDLVPLLGYHLHGGHYPVGGSGALTQALVDSLQLDGGELHLGCRVDTVELAEDGRGVRGVRLADGRQWRARSVVMAGDAIAALDLLQPAAAVPPSLRAELQTLSPATSMAYLHLGLRGPAPDLPAVVHLRRTGQPGLGMVQPSRADPSAAPAGYWTLELMRLLPPDEAREWFDDEADAHDPQARRQRDSLAYQQRKAQLAESMIDQAESVIPGLRQAIVFRREASPLTFRRYGLSTLGSIYGVVDAEGRPGHLPRRSPVPGLVFAGSATHGPGVEPAMISGAMAADALWPGLLLPRNVLASDAKVPTPAVDETSRRDGREG